MADEHSKTHDDPAEKPDEEVSEQGYEDIEPDPEDAAKVVGGGGTTFSK